MLNCNVKAELARRNLIDFTEHTFKQFAPTWFHDSYYTLLTKFSKGEIKKLAIFMPPQHGKSEGSTRRLPAYTLGIDPDKRIAIVSYSATKARKFNREIQRIIDTQEYRDVFPATRLNEKNVTTIAGSYLRNAEECEIMGNLGGFKTVGVGGALTGEPVDMLILDDIYKNAEDAWSQVVRENIEDWYNTVATTRLHNDSQQLIVFTRWHHADLAGVICKPEDGWMILKYPAIKTTEPTAYDPRKIGEPLWPERHSLDRLQDVKDKNPSIFSALYQQEPTPTTGALWQEEWLKPIDPDQIPYPLEAHGSDWDLAYTTNDRNSASAYVESGSKNGNIYITDLGFNWLEFPALIDWMKSKRSPHYIEAKASGKSAKQTLTSYGINAIEISKSSDKLVSTRMATPAAEAGRVFVSTKVLHKLMYDDRQGILRFPAGEHDDLNDALVQAISRHSKPLKEFKTRLIAL